MVNDVSSPLGRVVVRFAVVEWFHPKRWPAYRVGVHVPRVRAVPKRPGSGKPHANLITRGQWPNPDVSSVLRSPRAGGFGLRAEVERASAGYTNWLAPLGQSQLRAQIRELDC